MKKWRDKQPNDRVIKIIETFYSVVLPDEYYVRYINTPKNYIPKIEAAEIYREH